MIGLRSHPTNDLPIDSLNFNFKFFFISLLPPAGSELCLQQFSESSQL